MSLGGSRRFCVVPSHAVVSPNAWRGGFFVAVKIGRKHARKGTAVCCKDPRLVFFATSAAGLCVTLALPGSAFAISETDLPEAQDSPPGSKYTPIISSGTAGDYVPPPARGASESSRSSGAVGSTGTGLRSSSSKGPYSVVEWNPADLLWDRVHLSGEYVIVDGFAFGGMAEYQKQSTDKYKHATTAVGVTATQYIESQTLRGTFLRGEIAAMGSVFTRKDVEVQEEQGVYGLSLGADLGYRFLISQRFTGAASYGVRRVVPDFFTTQGDSPLEDWKTANKAWSMRVQLALGLAI